MTNGWIKLHRTLLDKAIFMNPHALQVFLYCLMKATYKDMKLAVGNRVIYLKPGQLLYGRKRVSQRLGMGGLFRAERNHYHRAAQPVFHCDHCKLGTVPERRRRTRYSL